MLKLTKFKVIFDLFSVCVYFIQQQNCKLYYIYLMIISETQSEIGHCSCDSAKFKAPADFSHHAILCMTLSLMKNQSTESTDGDGCIKALKWGGTGKTRITGKTTKIPERPKNNRGLFPVLILQALFV